MERRGFLKTLGVLAAASALPTAVDEWLEAGLITGQTFRLDSPLDLTELPQGFVISYCTFVANPGFVGKELIRLPRGGLFKNCSFDLVHFKWGDGAQMLRFV